MSQGFTRGVPIDTDPNLAANSNLLVPSQAAVIAYVNAHTGAAATTGPTIYTLDGTLLNNRTVFLGGYTLNFANSSTGNYFQITPGTQTVDINYSISGTGPSNYFTNLSTDVLTVTGTIDFAGGVSSNSLVVSNGTNNATLAPGYLQLKPLTGATNFIGGFGYVYVSSPSGDLIYRDIAGVDHNLLAATGSMIWPSSPGIAYYGGSSAWGTSITTSAGLANVITDETGTGALVFGTSPAITTSLTTGSTSFDLINTTATTVNFAGASTALTMGATTGTLSLRNPVISFTGNASSPTLLTLNTGATSTAKLSLFDTTITQILFGRASTSTTVGSNSGGSTFVFQGQNFGIAGTDPSIATSTNLSTGTAHIFNEDITAARLFNDATTVTIGGFQSTRAFGTNSSPRTNTGSTTLNLMVGPTASANTKTFNIGTGGATGHIVTLNIGNTNTNVASSTSTLYTNLVVNGNLFVNGTQTSINTATLQVTDKNIELGYVVPLTSISGTLSGTNTVTVATTAGIISGQTLTKVSGTGVFGTNAKVLAVLSLTQFTTDVNHVTTGAIVFDVGGATDITANGGGITLKGTTDKTLNWVSATPAWTSSENFDLASGKTYKINATDVLSSTTLGSAVVNSSLTKVGALSGGTAGFVKVDASGNLTSDNSTYLTTSSASSTYQPLDTDLTTIAGLSATQGNIIVGNSSNAWSTLAPGTSGYILTSNGAGAVPSWQQFTPVEPTFATDLVVYLTNNKTFGKYLNGQTIPSSGKTARQVIQDAITELAAPTGGTITLNATTGGYRTTNTIYLNQTAVSNVLNTATVSPVAPATSIASYTLSWRRGVSGAYTTLSTGSSPISSYTHSLTDTANNSQVFSYQYQATDNLGSSVTTSFVVTPIHSIPGVTINYLGTSTQTTTNVLTRELGNVVTYVNTTITRNNPNISPTSYTIDYSINGGSTWSNAQSGTITTYPQTISSVALTSLGVNVAATSWRTVATDSQGTYSASSTINFYHKNFILYSTSATIGMTEINAAATTVTYTNASARTFTGVTAATTEYTYYVYAAAAGNLTSIILDGAAPVLGAFTKQSVDVSGTNSYGATVTYRVYRSNATNAFTNNTLAFS